MREVPAGEWDGLELDAYYRRPYVESAALLEPVQAEAVPEEA